PRGGARRGRGRARRGDAQGPTQRRAGRGHAERACRCAACAMPDGRHTMKPVLLDGLSLTRPQLVAVAHGAQVSLDEGALRAVTRAAEFLAEQVRREEPIYGVSTGFGSNADKLLGAHPLRDELP